VTNLRLISAVLTISGISVAVLSGCGGGIETGTPTTVGAPTTPAGFQEQQKAIGGNMMDARSVTAKK
jgi:hypothetical protein